MKLAPLLAQYLYTNKRLDLPGIGSFLLDPSFIADPENNKNNKPIDSDGIYFESNTSINETADLVGFISSQAGKMKALAAADLDSHLQLAKQFLNIGKPFLFEGIGSIVKLQSGQYELFSAQARTDTKKEHSAKEYSTTQSVEESVTGYDSVFNQIPRKSYGKKPIVILLLLAGIALAIWGGYSVYKNSKQKNNIATVPVPGNEKNTMAFEDVKEKESSLPIQASTISPSQPGTHSFEQDNLKIVVEVANKERALQRYGTLKGWGLNIQMETKDSSNYNLFFVLPALVSDTTRIIDSLSALYAPSGKKAFILN